MTAEREALKQSARTFTEREVLPHLEEWEDADERAGAFLDAYTGRVTNPSGEMPGGSGA